METRNTYSNGPELSGLLGIVFVTLKLCGVISWSWWWVTAPFWGSFILGCLVIAVYVIVSETRKHRSKPPINSHDYAVRDERGQLIYHDPDR